MKSSYALSKSRDYWRRTFENHTEERVGMKSTASDAALFFRQLAQKRIALGVLYVDDTLYIDNSEYSKLWEKVDKNVDMQKYRMSEEDLTQSFGR